MMDRDITMKSGSYLLRLSDYVELLKPELTGLSVLTAVCAGALASTESVDMLLLSLVALGTGLVGGGAGVLNQYLERSYDAQMKRTERRPIASGRVSASDALFFGVLVSLSGVASLLVTTTPLAALLATATWASYLFVYTPLKRMTPAATLIGGIPGALPPLIGWAAVQNQLSLEAWLLFAILFFWQMPHFYSLAWMYRKDYARAGFQLLPAIDERGVRTGYHIVAHSVALLLVSIIAGTSGMMEGYYLMASLIIGTLYLSIAVRFLLTAYRSDSDSRVRVNQYSRQLFFGSLLYLPALMGFMLLNRF